MSNNQSLNMKDLQNFEQEKESVECSSCQGTGKIQPYGSLRSSKCQKCQGTGFVLTGG